LHLPSFHFITVPLQPAWHWLLNLVIIWKSLPYELIGHTQLWSNQLFWSVTGCAGPTNTDPLNFAMFFKHPSTLHCKMLTTPFPLRCQTSQNCPLMIVPRVTSSLMTWQSVFNVSKLHMCWRRAWRLHKMQAVTFDRI
jgi:hypothetical protein